MDVALRLRANVHILLEIMDVIDWTQLSSLEDIWHHRKFQIIDYHPGLMNKGADFVFSDPFERGRLNSITVLTALVPQMFN